jgi:hypothetical protein
MRLKPGHISLMDTFILQQNYFVENICCKKIMLQLNNKNIITRFSFSKFILKQKINF